MPITAPSPASVRGLPMQIRIALRDDYGKDLSPLSRAVEALEKEIGEAVTLRIDWNEAWTAAQAHFKDDTAAFVPLLMDAARGLVSTVQATIEADEEWGLALLQEVERGNGRKNGGLGVQILIDSAEKAPRLAWNPEEVSIVLHLPPEPAGKEYYYVAGMLREAIQGLWDGDAAAAEGATPLADRPAAAGTNAPSTVPGLATGTKANSITRMPKLSEIPRPAALGEATVPYWATIFWFRNKLEVYGTHPPSIDLLIGYMEKHLAVNQRTTNKMETIDNALGTGKTGVMLELRSNWGPEPNAMMPLQFFQGALGYRVDRTTGSSWVLRRDVPFAP